MCLTPLLSGCNGCRPSGEDDPAAQTAARRPFEVEEVRPLPHSEEPASDRIKPGHWSAASARMRSNLDDARGTLNTRVELRAGRDFRASPYRDEPPTPERSVSEVESSRPVTLPKGQRRRFDFRIMPGDLERPRKGRALIQSRLSGDTGGYEPFTATTVRLLGRAEYFFVALTTQPNRFNRLRDADWVRPPRRNDDDSIQIPGAFHFVIPPSQGILPLADTFLDWTSTAVVYWDDLSPEALTSTQIDALEDWLYFGGRLIVGSPAAAESLDDTLLADLLPITPTGVDELANDEAASLLRQWSIEGDASTPTQIALLENETSRLSLVGTPHPDAQEVTDTFGLLYRRQIGRGCIVQSRIDLTQSWLAKWRSYDGFINGAVLGKPGRRYVSSSDAIDMGGDEINYTNLFYRSGARPGNEPADSTDVRLLSRDGALPADVDPTQSSGRLVRYRNVAGSVAAWNDRSDVVTLSSKLLRQSSGIEIPGLKLVLQTLGFYLLILVPLNYIVFRVVGRVEYAWLAIPLIAIGGAVYVARAARLDIGFARSLNEIAVVELPSGARRGHVCRTLAIYNSLSTNYTVQFQTQDAAARAIGEVAGPLEFVTNTGDGPALRGFQVASNQARLLHTEEMLDLGGTIRWDDGGDPEGGGRVVNESGEDLSDAILARRRRGRIEMAYLGELAAESAAAVEFGTQEIRVPSDLPMQIGQLMAPLASGATLDEGECKLVARIAAETESMACVPTPPQGEREWLLVATLQSPPLRAVEKDENLMPEDPLAAVDDE